MSFDATGKTVDQILDYGAPGLRYWEHFLPLYAKAFGNSHGPELSNLYARYDEQRGTNLAEFDTARTTLDKALTDAETRWSSHQSLAHGLPAAWTGATGPEAAAIVTSQLRRSREDLDAARAACDAVSAAIDPLRESVLAKARVALALLEPTASGEGRLAIDGKTPDDVDALIAIGDDHWMTTTFRPDVERKLTTFTAACDATHHTFESHYRTILTSLTQVIDHPYPQPSSALLPQPDLPSTPNPPTPQPLPAQSYPTQSYPAASSPFPAYSQPTTVPHPQRPTAAADYAPAPANSPESPGEQPYGSASRATAAPETTAAQSDSTEPAAATEPASSLPASSTTSEATQPQSDQFARTLKDTLEKLETGLQQGITSTLEKLGSLTTQTPTPATNSDTTSDPNPDTATNPDVAPNSGQPHAETPPLPSGRLEFDLAGKHFRLERTPDGTLTLAITDESGQTHTYTVTFDQNGNPTLTTADSPPSSPAAGPSPTEPPTITDSGGKPGAPEQVESPQPGATQEPQPIAPAQPDCAPPTGTAPDGRVTLPPDGCAALDEGESPQPGADQAPPACPAEPAAPTPTSDGSAPPEVSPSPDERGPNPSILAPPDSSAQPTPVGSPPGNGDVTQSPTPTPTLGSPDQATEIPEGGVEIPEIPQAAVS
ncbi:hypothetical protein [Nocardia sp. CDC160]|uniref:hypothetical protein n=1 Tax=Nocardia sp. CDC160 TaxID=3112166 RepID=UPI002DB5C482|nr:hypothetical protein [Nocardia sp. CDC160]MEC3913219.1 hypothetical protein [Nocardia sp. CDC160]